MGAHVDTLKYAGGSFALMPREAVRALNDVCHEHEVDVSTGGFLEYVLTQRGDAVYQYLDECRELGFDIVEISSGFVTLPMDDLVRLTNAVCAAGLKPKPEVGIQFGAGGTSSVEALEAEGTLTTPGDGCSPTAEFRKACQPIIPLDGSSALGRTKHARPWRSRVRLAWVHRIAVDRLERGAVEDVSGTGVKQARRVRGPSTRARATGWRRPPPEAGG
jgi:hypothetical protein